MPTEARAAPRLRLRIDDVAAGPAGRPRRLRRLQRGAPGHPAREPHTASEVRAWVELPARRGRARSGSRSRGDDGARLRCSSRGSWLETCCSSHPDRPARGDRCGAARPGQGPAPAGLRLCASTRPTTGPARSTAATASSSWRPPTGAATRRASPTCRWPGWARDPLAYLRGRIDEVDDELAVLLARRVALTAPCRTTRRSVATPAATRTARPRSWTGWRPTSRASARTGRGRHAHRDRREPGRLGGPFFGVRDDLRSGWRTARVPVRGGCDAELR